MQSIVEINYVNDPIWGALMKGQWTTVYPNEGAEAYAMIDIDQRREGYSGAVTISYGPEQHIFVVNFNQTQISGPIYIDAPVQTFEYGQAAPLKIVPEGYARHARALIEEVPAGLKFTWTTDVDSTPRFHFVSTSKSNLRSTLKPRENVRSWDEFKSFLGNLQQDRYSFRGQSENTWRLRSAFHRAGRSDLYRYFREDINAAAVALAPHLRRQFDFRNANEHASFLHLLQHHGYPTPLLDWSRSPFVAAYFAFARRRENADTPVRIHVFDPQAWEQYHSRSMSLTHVGPTLIVLAALPIDNPRSRPQQSLSTATNLDDLELYIEQRESQTGGSFLFTIDLPYSERTQALRDLRTMNITAESLFPGIDGTCQALAIEQFDLDTMPLTK